MGLFRKRSLPARLFLTRADGRSLRREFPSEQLDRFLARVLANAAPETLAVWRRAAQVGSAPLLAAWPEGVAPPERALLGAATRDAGAWLEAAYPRGASLPEIAAELLQRLAGASPEEAIEPEAVEETPPAPVPVAVAPVLAPAPALLPPPAPEAAPAPPPPAPAAAAPPLPEVIAPGARVAPARAGALSEHPDDVFGLWGAVHPADAAGDSPELRAEDLPWLCPGDRLYSPRRGSCRLAALEDAQGRWRIRDERGREILVSSTELTAEFSFDDEEAREA